MKKLLPVILAILFTSVYLSAQAISIKEILNEGEKYCAVLDTTGVNEQNDIDALLAEIKKQNCVNEVILVDGRDSGSVSLKQKLNGRNVVVAGLFIPGNIVWKALNGGIYSMVKHRFGSVPKNAGLKAIGANPFGSGFSVTYTSNSASGLKSIILFKDDEKSFYAVMNNQVMESLWLNSSLGEESYGSYDKSAKVEFSKSIEDMNYFFNTVQSVHPHPLRSLSPENYLALKKHIADTLAVLDQRKDLTFTDLSILLAEASEKFRDGHTSLLPEIKNPKPVNMFPFRMVFNNGRVVIGNALKDASMYSGNEILEINGMSPEAFLKPVFSMISGEKNIFKWTRFVDNQVIYLTARQLITTDDIMLSLKDARGIIYSVHLKPAGLKEFLSIPKEKVIIGENNFMFLPDGKTALFRYYSFIYSEKEKALIDSLFKMMSIKKTKQLIIDLRNNGGGNSGIGDYIISYLTLKPYRMFSRIDVKLSKELLATGNYKVFSELEGMTISHSAELKTPAARNYGFTGKIIVLTSNNTFSSAADFAAAIKDFSLGIIIGSETGGMRQCFGDIMQFSTPNYKIPFSVSHKLFFAPVPKPDDEDHGTIPDIEIKQEMLSDYTYSDDPVLDFTLNYLRK